MGKCVMRIIVNEERKKNEATYEDIIQYLWQNGVSGATAFRSTASIDDKKQLHYQLLEDVYFNDLAIIIESVMDRSMADSLTDSLKILVGKGQISFYDEKESDDNMDLMYDIRVYTQEHAVIFKHNEYEKVLNMLKESGVKWATVSKGIAGYGENHKMVHQKIFSFSVNEPILIECLTAEAHLKEVLDKINEIIAEGTICTIPVQVYIDK
ncbi:MAG: DUF190 domain-containing protein [Lacrimispora sp.]